MIGLLANARFDKRDAQGQPVLDKDGNRIKISLPVTPKLAVLLATTAESLSHTFDFVQWPVLSKAQGGEGEGCDGYGVYDPWDLASKNQQGSQGTRFADKCEDYMRAVSALQAYGVLSWGDLALHQMSGEDGGPGVFRPKGADGQLRNGRGQYFPGCFRGGTNENNPIPPFRPQDPVWSPRDDNTFGRELVYQNCLPAGHTTALAIDHTQKLVDRLELRYVRIDDVKGLWLAMVMRLRQNIRGVTRFYGELFDGDPDARAKWRKATGMWSVNFTLHWRLQAACNGYDATALLPDGTGYWGDEIAFMDNPDTDLSDGQQVIANKGIGYAYMMCLPVPCVMVYGKDYYPASVWPGAYGLKPLIDNLSWIARTFAIGRYQQRWIDRDVWAYTRDGDGGVHGWSGGLLMAGNFNPWTTRTCTFGTTWAPNTHLHDYTGHIEDVWTDWQGNVTVTLPANTDSRGQSYIALAPAGVNHRVAAKTYKTTQKMFGAADLDILPVWDGMRTLPDRIYAAETAKITATLTFDRTAVSSAAIVGLSLISPTGALVANAQSGKGSTVELSGWAMDEGWYTFRLFGTLLPDIGAPFTLVVTYTGA